MRYESVKKIQLRMGIASAAGMLAVSAAHAQSDGPTLEASTEQGWVLIDELSDEFDGKKVDRSKWADSPGDWGPWSWEPENVTQTEGKLGLTIRYEPHLAKRRAPGSNSPIEQQLYYTSGIIRSKKYQTYGYFEARLKGVPTYPGSSPAFWIYSQRETNEKYGFDRSEGSVTYSEIDIVELQQGGFVEAAVGRDGPEVMDMNLHMRMIENGKEIWKRPGSFPEMTKNKVEADFDPRDGFHIYGARVTPDLVIWYLDGNEVARKPNLYWHLPMHVTLSLGLRTPHVTYRNCPDNFWRCPVPAAATGEGYPSTMEVDWVRTWHMPGEDKIGSPEQVAKSAPKESAKQPAAIVCSQFKPGVDDNSDGKISGVEFIMHMGARDLEIRDTDGDGKISKTEWLGQNEGGFQKLTLDRFNKDGDDIMSADEVVQVYLWVFQNRDKNKDGFLSVAESPPLLIAN